ncbi:MAG TPA: TfoX/Sxy family protein, partial [Caulifigura sp.]|nr:TfoX/Sxy family protein [Caulifigura sp.]
MASDEQLVDRVRDALTKQKARFTEKRMFGGVCFMVNGKMCVCVSKTRLMARIDPDLYDDALTRPGCSPMKFTGRPMRGFLFVSAEVLATARQLNNWIGIALDY